MYARYEGHPVITKAEWLAAGLSVRQYQYDYEKGVLSVFGEYHNPLIDLTSIRRPERRAMIEAKYGPIEEAEPEAQMKAEVDTEARAYYTSYRKGDGSPLEPKLVEQYTNRASLLETLRKRLESQQAERAKLGRKVKMGEWYQEAMKWYNEQRQGQFPCAEIGNARSFERVFKAYCNEGYASVVSGRIGNDSARKVSVKAENLIVALADERQAVQGAGVGAVYGVRHRRPGAVRQRDGRGVPPGRLPPQGADAGAEPGDGVGIREPGDEHDGCVCGP